MNQINVKEKIIEELMIKNENQLAEFLSSTRKKVLFGQGTQGRICYEFCDNLHINVEAFMCSKKCNRSPVLPQNIPFFFHMNYVIQSNMMCF